MGAESRANETSRNSYASLNDYYIEAYVHQLTMDLESSKADHATGIMPFEAVHVEAVIDASPRQNTHHPTLTEEGKPK
jgi:hypothetical protein